MQDVRNRPAVVELDLSEDLAGVKEMIVRVDQTWNNCRPTEILGNRTKSREFAHLLVRSNPDEIFRSLIAMA